MEGWVSFHRKIEEWEWYDDANTFRLFFHLVLKANHKDNKWHGIDIKRGEIITSNEQLAKQLKLTVSKIRTSLEKLKSTGEIAIKTTNKNTVVTVVNYCLYQSNDEIIANKTTNKSQTNRKQIATNNNDNNENKKETSDFSDFVRLYPGKKVSDVREKKLPGLIKMYGKEQMLRTVERYAIEVKGKKDFILNESTFWNGRYKDYLDVNQSKTSDGTTKPNVIIQEVYYNPFGGGDN